MQKRGISPLIAVVILIGVTTSLAILVLNFSTSLFESTTEEAETFKIYPNPTTNYLYFDSLQDLKYTIINSSGNIMISDKLSNGMINVSALSKGVYRIRSSIGIQRFIKL